MALARRPNVRVIFVPEKNDSRKERPLCMYEVLVVQDVPENMKNECTESRHLEFGTGFGMSIKIAILQTSNRKLPGRAHFWRKTCF